MGKRVTVDLTTAAAAEVERIRKAHEMTVADIFRYGFTLLRIYLECEEKGRMLIIADPKNDEMVTRILIPN